VLIGDEIVAAIDMKVDRENRRLAMRQWTWVGKGSDRTHRVQIEQQLHRFEQFQMSR
jgi:uncharacterized protein YcaQ